MRWNRWFRISSTLPVLLLACGCLPFPWVAPPPAGPALPPPIGSPPPTVQQVAHEEPASHQAADLAQRLAEVQDESKVFAARMQELQGRLEEKTRALALARAEVRTVTEEVKQTREEVERWSREVANQRSRAQAAEKENQASLKALAQLLEMVIGQESPPATPPAASPREPVPQR